METRFSTTFGEAAPTPDPTESQITTSTAVAKSLAADEGKIVTSTVTDLKSLKSEMESRFGTTFGDETASPNASTAQAQSSAGAGASRESWSRS